MSIKKLQKKNGVHYCRFGECSGNKIPAVWCNWHHYLDNHTACDGHKMELEIKEDDGHMTIADEMTWGRL